MKSETCLYQSQTLSIFFGKATNVADMSTAWVKPENGLQIVGYLGSYDNFSVLRKHTFASPKK